MQRLPVLVLAACILACLVTVTAGAVTPEAMAEWKMAKDSFDAGKCVAALVTADRAIALDPAFGRPWNVRGCALHCLGRNTAALEAFEKAADLDPSLTIVQKNIKHVQADLQNGAPLDTPVIMIPSGKNSSVPHDGELGYVSPGEPTGCSAYLREGHAITFTNTGTIVVTGLRIAGCKYGDAHGKVRVEVWDTNLSVVSTDTVPYDDIPVASTKDEAACLRNAAWAEIDLPDHAVTGNFTVVLFTGSGLISQKEPGMFIVYGTPSDAKTSSVAATGPDRFEAQKVGSAGYRMDELDWMVRVLYTHPVAAATEEPAAMDTPFQLPGETPAGPQQTATPSAPCGIAGVAGALAIAALITSFRK